MLLPLHYKQRIRIRFGGRASASRSIDFVGRTHAAVAIALDVLTQATVAIALGGYIVTVAKWMARHQAAGVQVLAAEPIPGRPRFLIPDHDRRVRHSLARADPLRMNSGPTSGWPGGVGRTVARLGEEDGLALLRGVCVGVRIRSRGARASLKRDISPLRDCSPK